MSILIAYKKGDTIYMGTDTRVVANDSKRNELCECNYKIQKLNGGMLLGITGEIALRQTLIAYPEIFTLDKNGKLTKKHIIKEIIPNLLSVLYKEGLVVEEENEYPYMKGILLLAHQGELYEICTSFSVMKYEDFQAVGRCDEYAQASLFNISETDNVNDKIIETLGVVAKYSQLVGSPYLLIDTKELKYNVIKGE